MSFSTEWFNQLSDVDQSVLATVHTSRYRPTVEDVMEQTEYFDAAFRDTLLDVVKALQGRDHLLSYRLRVESKHVYTYPKGRAYREQLNVGWYSRDQAWMRIGVGYRRATNNDKSVDDLMEFLRAIEKEGDRFDSLIGSFHRPYLTPLSLSLDAPSQSIITYIRGDGITKGTLPGWLFWGTRLDFSREEDREILESSYKLVDHFTDVFDRIKASPFGP
jgi:hypothetical protein